jgi:predicted nucleic acid-binding protein
MRQSIQAGSNVLSALMRDVPEPTVVEWLDHQPAESVWINCITLFEARLGLALLPRGRGRQTLEAAFDRVMAEDLDDRVLDFDRPAAEAAALLAARRQRAGQPVDMRDTQIAGIVVSRRAKFATRSVRHFSDLTVDVIDPWNTVA